MLGAQHAADAVGLQDELDVRCDGSRLRFALTCCDVRAKGRASRREHPRRLPRIFTHGLARPPTPDPELLERDAELLALDHALAEAVDGHGSVVAVEGPPGIGKSSLVNACIERAREREMFTIAVRATELERSYPYGLVRQSADSVALGRSPEERAALFTGAARARAADPGSRQLGGHRQPRTDVPAPPRPLLAHGQPGTRASAPDHHRRRPVGGRPVDGCPALPQPSDRRPADGAAPGGTHRRRWTSSPCRSPRSLPTPRRSRSGRARCRRRAPVSAWRRCSTAARNRSSPQRSITPPAATRSCSSSS